MNDQSQKGCGNCRHRVVRQLPPPNLGSIGVCMLLPPTPCVAFASVRGQAGIVAQVSARPQVNIDDICGQWEGAAPAVALIAPPA